MQDCRHYHDSVDNEMSLVKHHFSTEFNVGRKPRMGWLEAGVLEMMSREKLAECLRAQTLHVAAYENRFGEIGRHDLLELLGATEEALDPTNAGAQS